ncbi:response regulator [bacterium AH-315-M05]|nr:response regulator [bacterium AH-315-M05]
MTKANILIVEDEQIVAKDIEQNLKKLGYNTVGIASMGEDAIKMAEKEKPDLVLMDIMLKGKMTGIEAAKRIRKNIDTPVIYLTAYADEDTLEQAKITEPHGYIIKPFKEIDLKTTIEIALYKHKKELEIKRERNLYYSIIENKSSNGSIFVKSKYQLVKVNTKDIFFVEALGDYVTINTADKKYTVHSTMKKFEEKLPPSDFARVHRSYIVRLDSIIAIEHTNIIIEHNKKYVPIGNSFKEKLMNKLKLV